MPGEGVQNYASGEDGIDEYDEFAELEEFDEAVLAEALMIEEQSLLRESTHFEQRSVHTRVLQDSKEAVGGGGKRQLTLFETLGLPSKDYGETSSFTVNRGQAAARQQKKPSLVQTKVLPSFDCGIGEPQHRYDQEAIKSWIYPTNFPIRSYQFEVVQCSIFANTLCALPTGMGKTFIAAVLMYNYFRWFPEGKIVFMAPTKPLVAQQIEACYKIAGLPQHIMDEMTGALTPETRRLAWISKRIFFLTPQVMENDLKRGACPASSIVLLVVDEAHRAQGNHAYCEVIRRLRDTSKAFRILALTATPGSDVKTVQQVVDNLFISKIEIRTEDSEDIKAFTHERKIDIIVLKPSDDITAIAKAFSKLIEPMLQKLAQFQAFFEKDPFHVSSFQLISARNRFRERARGDAEATNARNAVELAFGLAISLSLYLSHLLTLGIGVFLKDLESYLEDTDQGDRRTKARQDLVHGNNFQAILSSVRSIMAKPDYVSHPKMERLIGIVLDHFMSHHGEEQTKNAETRVMIFSQLRSSVEEIVGALSHHAPIIRAMSFVGQSSGKNGASKGLKQKEQLAVIDKFQSGNFNVLVATCIGEEGLDIGEVDLIICYDSQNSPIRMLQRMGRTGRKREGRAAVLLSEGKEEDAYNRSQNQYRSVQKSIGTDKVKMSGHDVGRLLPEGVSPVCEKKEIAPPLGEVFKKKIYGKKAQAAAAAVENGVKIAKGKQVLRTCPDETPYLNPAEQAAYEAKFRPTDQDWMTQKISLVNYCHWQAMTSQTHHFSTSKRCEEYVETTRLIHSLVLHEDRREKDPFSDKMALFLDGDDSTHASLDGFSWKFAVARCESDTNISSATCKRKEFSDDGSLSDNEFERPIKRRSLSARNDINDPFIPASTTEKIDDCGDVNRRRSRTVISLAEPIQVVLRGADDDELPEVSTIMENFDDKINDLTPRKGCVTERLNFSRDLYNASVERIRTDDICDGEVRQRSRKVMLSEFDLRRDAEPDYYDTDLDVEELCLIAEESETCYLKSERVSSLEDQAVVNSENQFCSILIPESPTMPSGLSDCGLRLEDEEIVIPNTPKVPIERHLTKCDVHDLDAYALDGPPSRFSSLFVEQAVMAKDSVVPVIRSAPIEHLCREERRLAALREIINNSHQSVNGEKRKECIFREAGSHSSDQQLPKTPLIPKISLEYPNRVYGKNSSLAPIVLPTLPKTPLIIRHSSQKPISDSIELDLKPTSASSIFRRPDNLSRTPQISYHATLSSLRDSPVAPLGLPQTTETGLNKSDHSIAISKRSDITEAPTPGQPSEVENGMNSKRSSQETPIVVRRTKNYNVIQSQIHSSPQIPRMPKRSLVVASSSPGGDELLKLNAVFAVPKVPKRNFRRLNRDGLEGPCLIGTEDLMDHYRGDSLPAECSDTGFDNRPSRAGILQTPKYLRLLRDRRNAPKVRRAPTTRGDAQPLDTANEVKENDRKRTRRKRQQHIANVDLERGANVFCDYEAELSEGEDDSGDEVVDGDIDCDLEGFVVADDASFEILPGDSAPASSSPFGISMYRRLNRSPHPANLTIRNTRRGPGPREEWEGELTQVGEGAEAIEFYDSQGLAAFVVDDDEEVELFNDEDFE